MEANGLGGGLFSSIGPEMVGLELPIQQPQRQQQNPQHLNHSYDRPQQRPQSSQPPLKLGGCTNKSKQAAISDDDDDDDDGKRKMPQWQRMKWTDAMVRLLITAVFYIGDEVGPEGTAGADPAKKNNRKPSGAVLQQKKGKWKSVSRAMLEKGFYVSPQQCEDKFNDLNKRYKRVNDILGRGTACRVVEDQSLLESIDLAPRTREEVRKLLNSKHLFFREMCAYHNSCGHAPHRQSPELPSEPNKQQQQQPCLHSTDTTTATNNNNNERAVSKGEDEAEEDDKVDDDDDDKSEEDYCDDVDDEPRKRAKKRGASSSLSLIGRFGREVAGVVEDGTKSTWEKKRWLKARMVELEEWQVGYQYESFELEKQRLKWAKFSSKKEREMERAKLENEKKMLEHQRMVLLLRHNELELLDHNHNHNHNQHHSSITA